MKNEFSTFDLIKILKIHRERLQAWIAFGYIEASKKAHGQGTKAVFTRNDIYDVELFRRLVESGFSRKLASKTIKQRGQRTKWNFNIDLDEIRKEIDLLI